MTSRMTEDLTLETFNLVKKSVTNSNFYLNKSKRPQKLHKFDESVFSKSKSLMSRE